MYLMLHFSWVVLLTDAEAIPNKILGGVGQEDELDVYMTTHPCSRSHKHQKSEINCAPEGKVVDGKEKSDQRSILYYNLCDFGVRLFWVEISGKNYFQFGEMGQQQSC